jgi:hypothetical protein
MRLGLPDRIDVLRRAELLVEEDHARVLCEDDASRQAHFALACIRAFAVGREDILRAAVYVVARRRAWIS